MIYRRLAIVAVPIALQSLITSSLNLIDNLMVGMLGEKELAAVGAGMQIFFVSWIITIGFSAGCSTFAAQFWGAGDTTNVTYPPLTIIIVEVGASCSRQAALPDLTS